MPSVFHVLHFIVTYFPFFFPLNESIRFLFVSFHCLWLSSSYFCEDHVPFISTRNISFPFKEESKNHIGMFPLNLFISLYFFSSLCLLRTRFSAGLDLKGLSQEFCDYFCLVCVYFVFTKPQSRVKTKFIMLWLMSHILTVLIFWQYLPILSKAEILN